MYRLFLVNHGYNHPDSFPTTEAAMEKKCGYEVVVVNEETNEQIVGYGAIGGYTWYENQESRDLRNKIARRAQ